MSAAGFAVKTSAAACRRLLGGRLHVGQTRPRAGPAPTTVYCAPVVGVTVSFEPSWTTFVTVPFLTSARNCCSTAWSRRAVDCETSVKTTASATTTRTSITMPLRKNLGFNESLRIRPPPRGNHGGEYSAGPMTAPYCRRAATESETVHGSDARSDGAPRRPCGAGQGAGSGGRISNHRPRAYESPALPLSYSATASRLPSVNDVGNRPGCSA